MGMGGSGRGPCNGLALAGPRPHLIVSSCTQETLFTLPPGRDVVPAPRKLRVSGTQSFCPLPPPNVTGDGGIFEVSWRGERVRRRWEEGAPVRGEVLSGA